MEAGDCRVHDGGGEGRGDVVRGGGQQPRDQLQQPGRGGRGHGGRGRDQPVRGRHHQSEQRVRAVVGDGGEAPDQHLGR